MAPPERRAPRDFDHLTGAQVPAEAFLQPGGEAHLESQEEYFGLSRRLDGEREVSKARVDLDNATAQELAGLSPMAKRYLDGEREVNEVRKHSYQPIAMVPAKKDPFQVMDEWDDEVIINELKGEGPKGKLVYSFQQQGKTIVGLGKEGVDFCCQLLLQQGQVIRELDLTVTFEGEGSEREAYFSAKAGRFAVSTEGELVLDTVIGTKRQPLYNANRSTGEMLLNPHWYEHGSQKALRNARLRLLPIALREYVISLSKSQGRVQSNTKAKDDDPRTTASSDAQRKLYAQLLASHHVTPDEREKALSWMAERRHSMATMARQLDAVQTLIQTRAEAEKLRTPVTPKPVSSPTDL